MTDTQCPIARQQCQLLRAGFALLQFCQKLLIMDIDFQTQCSTEIICQNTIEADSSCSAVPVLPYRSSTMPENLSMRLKHPNILCTNSWLKRSPSDHSDHIASRLRCSRSMEVSKHRNRPASMAPEVKHFDKNFPPPLPPKRTCSKSPILLIPTLKQPDFRSDLTEELKETGLQRIDEDDVCSALQKITKRLDQIQVERSPVLGHYSLLYRLDACPQMQTPKSPFYLPRLRQLSHRPQRCAYTNLAG
ncbi:unnamed protein product [Hymenolepis diminuta]|uniref:Calcium uniporter protein n=1 Tax=Hymenolepis diminuta TaxID=6216 RepID=A0A0R3S8J3_HYMDI|nr:unnamed protein product [Hymenolepis diminuta]VUZ41321.1 unnamed protein product [Hymenolepis diminuta]